MNQLDALVNARNLIADPDKWTQGAMGRTANGFPLDEPIFLKLLAICFCAYGALLVSGVPLDDEGLFRPLYEKMGGSIVKFNDTHTHAEVIEAFDQVIASLKEE